MIDRVAARLDRALVEVPVGFKWFTKGLLAGTMGFAGEESGGASFLRRDASAWTTDKDGLIVGLLAAEITARTGANPAARYDRIAQDLGQSWYERIDAPATAAERLQLKALTPEGIGLVELAGEKVQATIAAAPGNGAPIGGVKVVTAHGWFAARPSGTEDIYKIYAESFRSEAHLHDIQQEARNALARVFQQPADATAAG
jgi:phosphoglucomutase